MGRTSRTGRIARPAEMPGSGETSSCWRQHSTTSPIIHAICSISRRPAEISGRPSAPSTSTGVERRSAAGTRRSSTRATRWACCRPRWRTGQRRYRRCSTPGTTGQPESSRCTTRRGVSLPPGISGGVPVALRALDRPRPGDLLFIEPWIYRWGVLFEYSVASYHVGEIRAALGACDRLLRIDDLPDRYREHTLANREHCRVALGHKPARPASDRPSFTAGDKRVLVSPPPSKR